ncbi:zinc finger CCHC domain-containing protein 8 homolog isoform X2 [Anthonomus grandis grandis]|uniref:zinc finger CCHC domain-containing protein 8 homolog isoform X2 n=1 Tax=Anthonomus grandis grandis TaxID=2921223 RepID=UPI002165B5D4|nr:zinc finger CCHC domain-containing protein 8 homolog isoform X2 [Anthonomus grandis grandis]
MASRKNTQRKRKSGGIPDIFEVCDKDLSPEPEEINAEPETKISKKKRDSDVSDSRGNQHNLSESTDADKSKLSEENDNNSLNNTGENVGKEEPTLKEEPPQNNIIKDESMETIEIIDSFSVNEIKPDVIDISDTDGDKETALPQTESTIIEPRLSPQTSKYDDSIICIDDTIEDGEVNETMQEEESDFNSPIVTIKFKNKSIADTYKIKFMKLFQSFVELITKNVDDVTINIFRDENINPKEWVVLDHTVCVPNEEEDLAKQLPPTPLKPDSPKKKKKKKKPVAAEPELFVVDTNPETDNRIRSYQTKYSTKFSITEEQKSSETNSLKPTSGSVCFNCESEHSLKDCPHPKDFAKINANRQKHQNKAKSSRYHKEDDQKYAHLQPGKISAALRKALMLKKNQIPSFVYQMRRLGYPPGWLEEAKYVTSELSMFDIDGNNVKNPNARKHKGLDPEKVVEFPGFNAPLSKEFKDEHKYYRVPPYSNDFSKENMIEVFKKIADREEDDLQTQDMEIANDDSIEDTSSQEESQDKTTDSDSNAPPSLSLLELEKQKNKLLEEIQKSSETLPWDQGSSDTTNPPSVESTKAEENRDVAQDKKEETDIKSVCGISQDVKNDSPPTSQNSVKHSTFGTPILKSASPYVTLPNPDNFMVGVSPVIDFENLPNSTGKYEQMTGVLQKVRNTLKGLQKPKT